MTPLRKTLSALFCTTLLLAGCGGGGSLPTPPPATPLASLSATAITFTGTTTGTTSAAQTVTLSNPGTASLTGIAITVGGTNATSFNVSNNCGSSLAAGAYCTISATFSPTSPASYTATISIADNATGSPQTVTLTGAPVAANQCSTTVQRKSAPTATAGYSGLAITGKVMAGSLAQIGASVQLYAAGSTGLGSAPTALGSASTTDSSGNFSISASYTCPYNLSLLYVVARGGKAGATGIVNPAAVMLSALGVCNALTAGTTYIVDEATTVASAYAFAQFLAPGGNIGATATNFRGLALAAAGAQNLVNPATGKAPGATFPATVLTSSMANLNSLANALNACIVTTASCAALNAAATIGTSVPTNTLDAMLNIARKPGNNVAALYLATTASSAYTPADTAAPTDYSMFLNYGGGGMNLPSGLGIDSTGNVWVASYANAATAFSNTGTPLFPSGITGNGLINSYGLAVDFNDNPWIPNEQSYYPANGGVGSVSVFNPAGAPVADYLNGGLNYPVAISVDPQGYSWVVDYGNSHITILKNDGTPVSGVSGYVTSQFSFPVAVAVDSKCYGYIGNQSSNNITRVPPDGSSFTSFITGAGPSGLAVDGSDNVWTANYYGNSVGQLAPNGTIVSSGYTNAALNHPQGVAIDGAGNVWVANYRSTNIAELAGSASSSPGALLTPSTGLGADSNLLEAFAIAIDAAGNVWVTSFGSNTLTEFVGLAAPVRTPLLGPAATP